MLKETVFMPRIAIVFAASFLLLASPVLVLAVTAPQNLNVVPISSCAFNISWIHNQQSGDRYDVKRDSVLITGVGVSTTGNQHSFRDLNQYWLTVIDPSTTHAYEVRAFNTVSGEGSDYTSLFSATTNALPTTPGSPQNLVVTEASAGVIKLDWNNGSPVSTLFSDYGGFLVERAVSTDGGANFGDFVKIDRIPASNSFYNDGVFDVFSTNYPSISYKYRVLTQEVGGEGCNPDRSAHTVVSLPSSEVVVPPAPTNLTGTFNGQSREITLRWQDNSLNEVRFELERSLSSSFAAGQTTVVASNISANTTSYVDAITDPTPQNYYYRLRSCTATACSFFSNSASVSSGVLAPTNLTAGIVSISGLTANTFIKWEGEILENTTYLIERADSSRNFTEIAQVSAATVASQNKTFYDNNVPLHDNYYYRVRVRTSGGGLSAYSNEATLDLNILYVVKGLAW
ncbi:MAG TPA: hypothetical protein VNK70_01140, partial [Candidatus Paceibacterota bacterium]|nr:hypothetical protein [Candidatus Paceibacterota bacterium]